MNNMNLIKTVIFITMVTLILILETFIPKKNRVHTRRMRWSNNLLIILTNRILTPLFLLVPIFTMARPFKGMLQIVEIPHAVRFIIGFLLLDMVIYFQHRLFHIFSPFWSLHKMHHTDRDLDFTSALRFHPLEIFISMCIKLMAVWILGIDNLTLVIFEISLNSCAIFNHGNFGINQKIERVLKFFIITPDLHRIHHSVIYNECNSNYGTIFTIWDFLFKSLNLVAQKGQDGMVIGIPGFKNKKFHYFHWMLITPFIKNGDKRA